MLHTVATSVSPRRRSRFPDLLVLAQEDWDLVERRNQLLVRALAARNPTARTLFVERAHRPRDLGIWRAPRVRQVARNVWSMRPLRPAPDRVSQRFADAAEALQIRRAARQVGLSEPLLWTQDPRAANLIDLLGVSGLIYDLTDDWAAFERDPDRRAAVDLQIQQLTRRAGVVFACSRWLEANARLRGAKPIYVPNAVDPPAPRGDTPEALGQLTRPRLGYVGTLHSDRLDVELISRVAELRPQWSIVLLGPDLLTAADRQRLLAAPNVAHLGVIPHPQVRTYLEGMDVGLVTHLVTDFTRSLDPLKLYEYLAAGLPVVATPAGIADELAPFVTQASSPDEFVHAVELELDRNDAELAQQRRTAMASETWDARAAEIETALGVDPPAARTDEVSVVIVSFNTRGLLERCLDALKAQTSHRIQTIVVDNGSSDGSREMVRERFPDVELIELDANAGFGAANNLAFARCRGSYILLLNSDAFLHDGAVDRLVAVLTRDPRAAVAGPRLLYPDGAPQRSAWPFPAATRIATEAVGLHRLLRRTRWYEDLGTWEHDGERTVDFLIGACLLLRASALDEVGGFDEAFWMYGEEADLQRRLQTRGWSVVFTPDARCTHVGGASSIEDTTRLGHFYRGQMRFLRKHSTGIAWPIARVAQVFGSLLRGRWRTARVLIRLR